MLLSRDDLKSAWINAGGNPTKADQAASVALAASGGNTNSQRGLFGLTAGESASGDPVQAARHAVELSANGTNWKAWEVAGLPIPDPGVVIQGPLGDALSTVTGVADGIFGVPQRWVKYGLMAVAGSLVSTLGLLLMVIGSRQVRQMVRGVGESVLGGAGFAVGANAVTPAGGRYFGAAPGVAGGGVAVPGGGGPAPVAPGGVAAGPAPVAPGGAPFTPGRATPRGVAPVAPGGARPGWAAPTRPMPAVASPAPRARGVAWVPSPPSPASGGPMHSGYVPRGAGRHRADPPYGGGVRPR